MRSSLPVFQVRAGQIDIETLTTFVPATQKQNDRAAFLCVINAIAGPKIDTQLPNASTAEFIVTEVAKLDTVDALIDSSLRLTVAKRLLPCEVDVLAIPR